MRFLDWCHRHLSWHLTILEDIGSVLNGPFLLIAAIIAGVNQIQGGAVLQAVPWIGTAWAIMQVIGIDLQYSACARRIKDNLALHKRGQAFFWIGMTAVLAVPVTLANIAFTLQLMLGWTDAQAISLIGLTPLMIAIGRGLLQGLLAFVSAITRETRRPAEASEMPVPLAPTPPKPKKRAATSTRSHTGTTVAQQQALKQRRILQVVDMLAEAERAGSEVSVGMVAKRLGINSNSQASTLRDAARTRYQAG